jgi:acyl-CoA thioester hydrolase
MKKKTVHQYERRVYYADTDIAGVVYHANYLRFFEEARTEYLRSLGFDQSLLIREVGVLFLVKNIYEVDYIDAARLDDILTVECDVIEVTKITAKIRQNARMKSSGKILVTAELRLVCVSSESFKPTKIPTVIKEKLEQAT